MCAKLFVALLLPLLALSDLPPRNQYGGGGWDQTGTGTDWDSRTGPYRTPEPYRGAPDPGIRNGKVPYMPG